MEKNQYTQYQKRLLSLFSNSIDFEVQCCQAILHMLLYEHTKFMLVDQIIDFMNTEDILIAKPRKSKKYIKECQDAGGPFELGFKFYNLDEAQREIINKAHKRRGYAAHKFLDFFLAEEHFSASELRQYYEVVKLIDNFWTVDVEMSIAGYELIGEPDWENVHSVYFELITQIANRVFALEDADNAEEFGD